MLSYPYIQKLMQAVLGQSKSIQGRVYWAPYFANELNSANLENIINDSLKDQPKHYPLSLMLPPVTTGDLSGVGWQEYHMQQLFLKRTGLTGDGQPHKVDEANRNMHTIPEEWHDMRRVAVSMFRLFRELTSHSLDSGGTPYAFRISSKQTPRIATVTNIGNDKLSGVLVSYLGSMYEGCVFTDDYDAGAVNAIVLPVGDQHPPHAM